MIVFDENIHQQSLMNNVARWYRGQVVSIRELRRGTFIQDEAIPGLLQQFKEATLITTNISDFWRRIPAHRRYCVICFALPNEQAHEIPALLRRLLHHPEFRTKAARTARWCESANDRFSTMKWAKIRWRSSNGLIDVLSASRFLMDRRSLHIAII